MQNAICNGCGNESPAWDQLCDNCSQLVICQNCSKKYKRGQGLQEVDLCATCLNEVFSETTKVVEHSTAYEDAYERYGFDHKWEL
jgi:predicted amidophosphoribosyltransferase